MYILNCIDAFSRFLVPAGIFTVREVPNRVRDNIEDLAWRKYNEYQWKRMIMYDDPKFPDTDESIIDFMLSQPTIPDDIEEAAAAPLCAAAAPCASRVALLAVRGTR